MSDKILPATDQEISEWREDILGERPDDGDLSGIRWMESDEWSYRLVHRIEADRATIRAKDALIAELVEALTELRAEIRAAGTMNNRKYDGLGIKVNRVLAKAKEAGQ